MDRRRFLQLAGALASGVLLGSSPWERALAAAGCPLAQGGPGPYGPLLPPDANGIRLPAGFTSRVVAAGGEEVAATGYTWRVFPDGGATYRSRRQRWIYVANSEWVAPAGGGAQAILFGADGTILDAYPICDGTVLNCAGGKTPWYTWLSCEEYPGGHVWECDVSGVIPPVMRPALGTFQHEAVAVDWRRRRLYLTEDQSDGRFYRFTPAAWPDLSTGAIEVAQVMSDGSVVWHEVPNPNPIIGVDTETRHQVPESTAFRGGEGIARRFGHVYFTTKLDNRVWDYRPAEERICLLYEAGLDPIAQLTGVDNVTVSRAGDILVAEDGGNMELVMITPEGVAAPLLEVTGQPGSELAGPAFSPAGDRLYFSSQRGGGNGITYEVAGPFRP